MLPAIVTDVERRPAEGYALLIVLPDEGNTFTVRGRQAIGDAEAVVDSRIGAPDIALGDLAAKGGHSAAQIAFLFQEWSRVNVGLAAWLEELRGTAGDNLRLIVWDSTGHDIPWELFFLPGDPAGGRPGGWLGALVAVARRVSIRAPGQVWDPWEPSAQSTGGTVVTSIAAEMGADRAILAGLRARDVPEDALLHHLADNSDDVSLLYVACHGDYDKQNMLALRLGGLGLLDLGPVELHGLARSHGVVFLNACHSGRMTQDARLNAALFGFAEVFLRKGAVAVVGVLGRVETTLASNVARRIFADVRARPDTPLSVLLRDVRAAVATEVGPPHQASTDELKRLLYTFMYVLWGSPAACLVLELDGG